MKEKYLKYHTISLLDQVNLSAGFSEDLERISFFSVDHSFGGDSRFFSGSGSIVLSSTESRSRLLGRFVLGNRFSRRGSGGNWCFTFNSNGISSRFFSCDGFNIGNRSFFLDSSSFSNDFSNGNRLFNWSRSLELSENAFIDGVVRTAFTEQSGSEQIANRGVNGDRAHVLVVFLDKRNDLVCSEFFRLVVDHD